MLHYVTIPNFAKSMNYLIDPPILHGPRELQNSKAMESQRGLCLTSMRPLQPPQEGIGSNELMRLHIYHISYSYILILYLRILNFSCRYVQVFGIRYNGLYRYN